VRVYAGLLFGLNRLDLGFVGLNQALNGGFKRSGRLINGASALKVDRLCVFTGALDAALKLSELRDP
jgi:hypothetical protein